VCTVWKPTAVQMRDDATHTYPLNSVKMHIYSTEELCIIYHGRLFFIFHIFIFLLFHMPDWQRGILCHMNSELHLLWTVSSAGWKHIFLTLLLIATGSFCFLLTM